MVIGHLGNLILATISAWYQTLTEATSESLMSEEL